MYIVVIPIGDTLVVIGLTIPYHTPRRIVFVLVLLVILKDNINNYPWKSSRNTARTIPGKMKQIKGAPGLEHPAS